MKDQTTTIQDDKRGIKAKFKPGIYQHYKGNRYIALGLAKHSETLEELVVYIALYDNEQSKIWVRPLKMFIENIELSGKKVPRFKFLSNY